MEISDKPVNPCSALYYLAQLTDLVDGEQQDVHEAFMVMRQCISERRSPEVNSFHTPPPPPPLLLFLWISHTN